MNNILFRNNKLITVNNCIIKLYFLYLKLIKNKTILNSFLFVQIPNIK